AATAKNFTGSEFKCSALANDPGTTTQSALARLWTHGYLAVYAKAQNKLSFADGASFDGALLDLCKMHPEAYLIAADGAALAKYAKELPSANAAFAPASYTCKDYGAA